MKPLSRTPLVRFCRMEVIVFFRPSGADLRWPFSSQPGSWSYLWSCLGGSLPQVRWLLFKLKYSPFSRVSVLRLSPFRWNSSVYSEPKLRDGRSRRNGVGCSGCGVSVCCRLVCHPASSSVQVSAVSASAEILSPWLHWLSAALCLPVQPHLKSNMWFSTRETKSSKVHDL